MLINTILPELHLVGLLYIIVAKKLNACVVFVVVVVIIVNGKLNILSVLTNYKLFT